VDWLVERNNLYTRYNKIGHFAGKGSNHTIQHIINKSPLIELYRECHVKQCTIKHVPPNMTKTLQKLCDEV
ncbi:hypothetical protein DFJ58DRAFT_649650, partial [Suillus subalutaceus]|uniref:uncharacterized protein n=1 Tax=Suillus subalutaceus TaxID=48586 RepID=UPI001B86C3A3